MLSRGKRLEQLGTSSAQAVLEQLQGKGWDDVCIGFYLSDLRLPPFYRLLSSLHVRLQCLYCSIAAFLVLHPSVYTFSNLIYTCQALSVHLIIIVF